MFSTSRPQWHLRLSDARWPVCQGNSVGGWLVAHTISIPMPIHESYHATEDDIQIFHYM